MALTVIVDEAAPGVENMRRDRQLLERVLRGDAGRTVRFYGFSPPCLSLGRLQSEGDVDEAACARDGVDIVRRPTGGRAVLHDEEITYAMACPVTDPAFGGTVAESCARIHAVIAAGLRAVGVPTSIPVRWRSGGTVNPDCFAQASRSELLDAGGRKLVGSAQARQAGALLQHGSILLEPARTARYLRGAAAGRPSGGLQALLGRRVDRAAIIAALAAAFRRAADP